MFLDIEFDKNIDIRKNVRYNIGGEVGVIMRTVNVTTARNDIYNIINQTIINSEPIQITSKNGDVIMISLEDWEAIQETLNIVSIPGMKESILEGKKELVEDCKTLEDIGWNLK